MFIFVVTALLVLHDVDGQVIYVNPDHVVLLHPTHQLVAEGVNCVVGLVNGKRVSATEDCATIRKMIEDTR